jgi:nitroimidazol reductase NimA-like FMN-containing flavoprotein (pyridoxamine 5'-phosphate oxidase superfamily)
MANEFDTDYESAIVFGKATRVIKNSEKEEILLSVLNKYS